MFSIDTETGFDKVVVINAAWGLGENVVQGAVDPDEYQILSRSCPIRRWYRSSRRPSAPKRRR